MKLCILFWMFSIYADPWAHLVTEISSFVNLAGSPAAMAYINNVKGVFHCRIVQCWSISSLCGVDRLVWECWWSRWHIEFTCRWNPTPVGSPGKCKVIEPVCECAVEGYVGRGSPYVYAVSHGSEAVNRRIVSLFLGHFECVHCCV